MPSKSVPGDLPGQLLEAICAVITYCRQLLIRDRPARSLSKIAVIILYFICLLFLSFCKTVNLYSLFSKVPVNGGPAYVLRFLNKVNSFFLFIKGNNCRGFFLVVRSFRPSSI